MEIKAIETVYNGYRFRSRLEARWAVFFDSAGIKYEYEPEGFKTPDGTMYLPDFYLPELDTYCEVKGERPEAWEEIKKIYSTITWGGPIRRVLILGNVPATANRMGGLWHFPCLYWSGIYDEVRCGWWFFQDCSDDEPVFGHISRARYHTPWWIGDDGKFNSFGRKELSFQPISDTILREEISAWEERDRWERMTDEEREKEIKARKFFQDDCYRINKRTFDSFDKARQARFEHGETPTTAVALCRANEQKHKIDRLYALSDELEAKFIETADKNGWDYCDNGPYNLCNYKEIRIVCEKFFVDNGYPKDEYVYFSSGNIRDHFYKRRFEVIRKLRMSGWSDDKIQEVYHFSWKQLNKTDEVMNLYLNK